MSVALNMAWNWGSGGTGTPPCSRAWRSSRALMLPSLSLSMRPKASYIPCTGIMTCLVSLLPYKCRQIIHSCKVMTSPMACMMRHMELVELLRISVRYLKLIVPKLCLSMRQTAFCTLNMEHCQWQVCSSDVSRNYYILRCRLAQSILFFPVVQQNEVANIR